jgi:type I restriction enzyme, S subunit
MNQRIQKKIEWKKIELGDIFIFQNKTGKKAGEGKGKGKYKFFTSSSEQSKFIDDSDFEGEHLIFSTGGQAGIHYCKGKCSSSNDCFVVKVKEHKTNFIYLLLKSRIYLLERGFKGAGLKHLSKDYLRKIKISLPFHNNKPDLETQQKIASILEKAENLKKRRKSAEELLDEYLKSVFWEMFGNPEKNEKDWKIDVIENLVKKEKYSIKRGPFGGSLKKEIFVSKGYLVYEQFHALNDDFDFGRYFVDEKKFQELKAFEVLPGDIIISCSGVYLGKLAIVPKGAKKGIINQALLKISLDPRKYNNIFFTYVFRNNNFRERFFGNDRGSGIPNFPPMPTFKQFKFISPPIKLQNKFASIVEQVEKIKEKQKRSDVEINELFDALMNKAFKGELIK